jgi:hypothetical protein
MSEILFVGCKDSLCVRVFKTVLIVGKVALPEEDGVVDIDTVVTEHWQSAILLVSMCTG